jgi:hypothetical protein
MSYFRSCRAFLSECLVSLTVPLLAACAAAEDAQSSTATPQFSATDRASRTAPVAPATVDPARIDVAIIGAGIAGLAAARTPMIKGRGLLLSNRVLELEAASGLIAALMVWRSTWAPRGFTVATATR